MSLDHCCGCCSLLPQLEVERPRRQEVTPGDEDARGGDQPIVISKMQQPARGSQVARTDPKSKSKSKKRKRKRQKSCVKMRQGKRTPTGGATARISSRISSRVSPSSRLAPAGSPGLWLCRLAAIGCVLLGGQLSSSSSSHGHQLVEASVQQVQAQAQQQATSFQTQQQLAQMMQVFNGGANDTSSPNPEANHFKLLELVNDQWLLVGGRNVVYNLSLSSMREQRRIEWPASDEDVKLCLLKGKSRDQCQNYIRVLKYQPAGTTSSAGEQPGQEQLFVCGTNAYKPRCRTYVITAAAYALIGEESGEGACPYQENQNVTSTIADGELYSATAAQFSGIDGLIHRNKLRTEQFNPKQLNSPNFVSSFRYGDHVYFLFREIAIEHINCGKQVYSRIGRVCVRDSGGQSRANRDRWTSFVKARLNCSIPGEFPFYFDEIQASTQVLASSIQPAGAGLGVGLGVGVGSGEANMGQQHDGGGGSAGEPLVYAVFTTPTNSIGGSAVCAFRMRDIEQAFEGPFKWQQDSNSLWLPLPEGRVPSPRPGVCSNDSKRLPEENVNFIKENPLMDQAVESIWSQPLITMASINFRFTQIAVDVQVSGAGGLSDQPMRTDVIFVSTDDGRVFKLINTHHLQQQQQLQQQFPDPYYAATGGGRPLAAPQQMGAGELQQAAAHAQQQQQQATSLPDVSSSTIVIEELHLFDSRTPIVSLALHYPPPPPSPMVAPSASQQAKLIVLSSRQLKAVPVSRCERALTCANCLALYDPYCVWDLHLGACLSRGRGRSAPGPHLDALGWGPGEPVWRNHQGGKQLAQAARPPNGWFPPNSVPQPQPQPQAQQQAAGANQTLAWWSSCPLAAIDAQQPGAQAQVGAPYRSLFSSHLQVPSRFDYQSGHHLAHTALISFHQAPPTGPTSYQQQQQPPPRPMSECLTFCGGVGGQLADSPASSCAEFFQHQHHLGHSLAGGSGPLLQAALPAINPSIPIALGPSGQLQQQQQLQQQYQALGNLYTSENLYLAVIICTAMALVLGLIFGFALGKSGARKHQQLDSSICSSTFDETNLYMASTGSHGQPLAAGVGGLFASSLAANQQQHQQHHHPAHHQARTMHHQHPLLQHQHPNGGGTGYFTGRPALGQTTAALFAEAQQSLLQDHYGNLQQHQHQQQQQMHQMQAPSSQATTTSATVGRTLPPIPSSQPLIIGATHQNNNNTSAGHPSSASGSSSGSSSASSSSTSNTAATIQAGEQHNQLYLNQQQLLLNPAQQQQPPVINQNKQQQQQQQQLISGNNCVNLHQKSFTNSSIKSANSTNSGPIASAHNNMKLLQQQPQLQPNINVNTTTTNTTSNSNNKIYL